MKTPASVGFPEQGAVTRATFPAPLRTAFSYGGGHFGIRDARGRGVLSSLGPVKTGDFFPGWFPGRFGLLQADLCRGWPEMAFKQDDFPFPRLFIEDFNPAEIFQPGGVVGRIDLVKKFVPGMQPPAQPDPGSGGFGILLYNLPQRQP